MRKLEHHLPTMLQCPVSDRRYKLLLVESHLDVAEVQAKYDARPVVSYMIRLGYRYTDIPINRVHDFLITYLPRGCLSVPWINSAE